MAGQFQQVSVATTATALHTVEPTAATVVRVTNTGAASVFVGPSDVTTSTGVAVPASASHEFYMEPGERLFGIVASGTVTVGVARQRSPHR